MKNKVSMGKNCFLFETFLLIKAFDFFFLMCSNLQANLKKQNTNIVFSKKVKDFLSFFLKKQNKAPLALYYIFIDTQSSSFRDSYVAWNIWENLCGLVGFGNVRKTLRRLGFARVW